MELSKNAHKWYNHIIYLLSFTDIENPIKSKEIENRHKISGELVREVVRYARVEGKPIASNSNGYYMAKTRIELEDTIEHLEGRAKSMLKTLKSLKAIFPDENQETLF